MAGSSTRRPIAESWKALDLPSLSRLPVAEIVPQDLAVVEAQFRPRHLPLAEPARVLRVVGGLQRSATHLAPVDGGDGVLARVAPRIRVDEELLDEVDVETGLLLRLAHARLADLFAVIDESSRDRPAVGDVLAQDEHDAAVAAVDDRVRGREGVVVLGHREVFSGRPDQPGAGGRRRLPGARESLLERVDEEPARKGIARSVLAEKGARHREGGAGRLEASL